MKDAHKVCRDIHLCSNKKIDVFHRVGMIYAKKYLNKVDGANDLICEECQFAAHELQQVVDDHQVQVDVRKFFSDNVCSHLGQYRGSCDVLLDDFLPDLFQELHNLLQEPREFCEHVRLCKATQLSENTKHKEEHEEKLEPGAFVELMEKLNSIPIVHPLGTSTAGCLSCQVGIEAILLELESDTTSKALGYDLRDAVCPRLPTNMLDGCLDFLKLYAPSVVKMTVQQLNAQQVCNALHMCDKSTYQKGVQLDVLKSVSCEACTEASKMLEIELESRQMRKRLIHEAKHLVCDRLPSGLKFPCTNLTKAYVPLLLTNFLQRLQNNQLCHILRACN
ncbi:Saposin-like type B, 1 domain and Saposin B domain and Saposin-like domain-containing protein [Aphelenchoides fujianensis]|nr:Saposin-like type B, 1 domain and Saposin B domain and Saposin-like domain-containing protein [Aphelenchoides fujianensis]